jgi:hypothetical protein
MEEKKKKFPGKSAQGNMLEHNVSSFSNDMNIQEVDGNAAAKNIPGIDHFVDTPSHLFVQDKLHLSEHTAKPETYRKRYQNRSKMAKNFLESMAKDGTKGEKMRKTMKSITDNPNWSNKESSVTIHDGVEKQSDFKKILDRMQDVVAPWNEKGINSDDEAFVDPEEEEEAPALDREEEEDQADEEEELAARRDGRGRKRKKIIKHRKKDGDDSD